MKFNLNEHVKVKLNQRGLDILKANHEELFRGKRAWTPPDTDKDGYYRTQLWCLMQDFGPHIHLGGNPPFETEIILDSPSCEQE
jgi:hypothetical protein